MTMQQQLLNYLLGGERPQSHAHCCPSCGCVWEHDNPTEAVGRRMYNAAHDCPRCGAQQREKYWGERPVAVRQRYDVASQTFTNEEVMPV